MPTVVRPWFYSPFYFQTMEWQLTQKTAELDALTEQLRIVEEREKTEVLGLNHSLQVGKFMVNIEYSIPMATFRRMLAVGKMSET